MEVKQKKSASLREAKQSRFMSCVLSGLLRRYAPRNDVFFAAGRRPKGHWGHLNL
jgi:hypothetical protein